MEIRQEWRRFAEVYVETGGDTRAAVRAFGYTGKNVANTGTRLRKHPEVAALIAELNERGKERALKSIEATRESVLTKIRENYQLAKEGVLVVNKDGSAKIDAKGNIVRRPDLAAMNRAVELEGKTIAMFTDVTQNVGEMDGKSDAELAHVYLAGLLSNPMLLQLVCAEEAVIRGVHEFERRTASSGESGSGDAEAQAEPVEAAPEATGVPPGRVH